jgi:hypothetical protein
VCVEAGVLVRIDQILVLTCIRDIDLFGSCYRVPAPGAAGSRPEGQGPSDAEQRAAARLAAL